METQLLLGTKYVVYPVIPFLLPFVYPSQSVFNRLSIDFFAFTSITHVFLFSSCTHCVPTFTQSTRCEPIFKYVCNMYELLCCTTCF